MVSSMFLRHTGHARTVDAHCQHINECPHGFSTVCVGRSMHTLHSRVSAPAPRPLAPPRPAVFQRVEHPQPRSLR